MKVHDQSITFTTSIHVHIAEGFLNRAIAGRKSKVGF